MQLLRALIVDPDRCARREIAEFLGASSFDSVESVDTIGALRFAQDGAIDLIVADIDLRELDDLQLLRIIRCGGFGKTPPPVIVCSALLHEESWMTHPALKGVTGLAKPFTQSSFSAALKGAFAD